MLSVMSYLPLTLFGAAPIAVDATAPARRIELDPCCWVDRVDGFLLGADRLLDEMDARMDWYRGQRLMYGTWHDEPRRTSSQARKGAHVPDIVDDIRLHLSRHYDRAFEGLFCNFYERGSDSVAWHADRIGRTEVDPLVAIVSLGGPRDFVLRPQGGGPGQRQRLSSGDLLVMGGATQHHWEHSVPKVKRANPRMSITMRAGGPRLSLGGQTSAPRAATRRVHERPEHVRVRPERRPRHREGPRVP